MLIWRACVHKRTTAIAIAIVAVLLSARWSAAETLALQWDPPAATVPAGYLLWFGTASGSYSNSIDVGSVTMASVDGLSEGTTYYFAVQAYNASGEFGELSDELIATIRPAPPLNLAAAVRARQSIGLTWQSPSGTVSGFRIEVGKASGKSDVATIATGAPSLIMRNLPAGTYYIRVRSVNAGGVSGPSNQAVVTLVARAAAPSNLAAVVRRRRIVNLTWQAPPTGASSYRIEVGTARGGRSVRRLTTAATKLTIRDLPKGVYYVRVRSRNSAGLSSPSNEVVVRITRSAPPASSQEY